MEVKCKECGEIFKSERSLHIHLKKHKFSLAEYYEKHFPRKNLFNGKPIKFRDKEDYFGRFFETRKQMEGFLLSDSPRAALVAKEILQRRIEAKNYQYAPCHLEMEMLELPSIDIYKKLFGSYKQICNELEVAPLFGKRLPQNFENTPDIDDMTFLIDTREQKPFSFKNSIISKLHIGDYTCSGERFSNTFVERKSESDFVGTFGMAGFDRFCREMDEAVRHEAFIFVVVENTVKKITTNSVFKQHRSGMALVWHNLRKIQHLYPKNIQFVFLNGKVEAEEMTKSILYHGKDLWGCDLQYYIDKKEEEYVG